MKQTILNIILLKLKIKMNFLHKYMLLSHPGLNDTFILRTQPPLLLGKIVHGDLEELINHNQPEHYYKINANTAIFLMGSLDKDSTLSNRNDPAYVNKVMKKMGNFYLKSIKK